MKVRGIIVLFFHRKKDAEERRAKRPLSKQFQIIPKIRSGKRLKMSLRLSRRPPRPLRRPLRRSLRRPQKRQLRRPLKK